MSIYETIINILNRIGFFDLIIPFILVYTIIYGILAKTQLLGDPFDKDASKAKFVRSLISLIAISIAFLTVGTLHIVIKIKEFVPYIVLYIIAVFMLIVSIAAFYLPLEKVEESEYKKYRKVILIISLIILAILTSTSLGIISVQTLYAGAQEFWKSDAFAIIIIFLIIFAVVYFLAKPEEKVEKTKGQ